jgi:hypothetical protein
MIEGQASQLHAGVGRKVYLFEPSPLGFQKRPHVRQQPASQGLHGPGLRAGISAGLTHP